MRRLLYLLLVFLFVLPVFAVEEDGGEEYDFYSDSNYYDDYDYAPYSYQNVYMLPSDARIITSADVEPTEVEVSAQALDPVTPSNSNGLKSVLLNVIGDYSAIVVEYRYTNTNGTYNYVREVQPDYVWLCSAGLFALLLYCCFRLGGGWLCRI